jgi:aminoglycoside phosphotransferase (APT) family kinase protein
MDLSFLQPPFGILGDFIDAQPYGSGHINDTYAAVYHQAGRKVRYIHQRINHHIFKDVPRLMDNIRRVTAFAQQRLEEEGAADRSRRSLVLLPGPDGLPFFRDAEGRYWRTYLFIEGAATYDRAEKPLQAREAARAFGKFQALLARFPGERLHETIPGFHDTRARYRKLLAALDADAHNRAAAARKEIDWFRKRESYVDVIVDGLASGEIPERITHNDTKLNNVMLDDTTMEGVCVIDLDTVMPGSALYDFGDLVRTATNRGEEDTRDLAGIGMDMRMFRALTEGYLESIGTVLNEREIELLAFSGKLITFEISMRFLTDFVEGDQYFKTHRDGHNLERCRCQMAMVESIEKQETEMEQVVKERYAECV